MDKKITKLGLLTLLAVIICGVAQAAPVEVAIFAINDFHGNLEPPPGGINIADPAHPGKSFNIAAGGAERMATLLKRLKAGHKNSVFVAAGDLVGASPVLSNQFHDEPTVEALSRMGLEVSAVGNHEFDRGVAELLRLQRGGCHPGDDCRGRPPFKGARFHWLAASTMDRATGNSILPPYYVKRFSGIPVAFIGLTLRDTAGFVAPAGVAGVEFRDEAQTVNALVPVLKAKGVKAIVVLIHQGGNTSGGINDCAGFKGAIADLVAKFDKAVDLVVSGHTHQAYNCVIDGRHVTSAHRYGTLLTEIDLKLDRKTRDVASVTASNLVVDPALPPDPAITRLIESYRRRAGALNNRVIATLSAPLPAGTLTEESALGDIVADAMRAASDHAQIAFMNPGGIRVALPNAGPVTHGELFAVLPFGNQIVTFDLTGAQIVALLEQQWSDPQLIRIMRVSQGFSYVWDGRRPAGQHVIAGSAMLNGSPLRPDAVYRVAVPDFLAQGGDGMTLFTQGNNSVMSGSLLDALEAWLPSHAAADGKPQGRIKRVDTP